ncbi:MAG: hypothetical protein GXP49_13345 [Deltaproteobacteria bacterium]|nr:hypothetical protein [Deltaproteobacteria bacterium]
MRLTLPLLFSLLLFSLQGPIGCFQPAPTGWKAEVDLPSVPFWENQVIRIDSKHIQQEADAYCNDRGWNADEAAFLFGRMPLTDFDNLCRTPLPELLGDMYLSGYLGGLWLADVLGSSPGMGNNSAATDQQAAFISMLSDTRDRLDWASGPGKDVLQKAYNEVSMLLLLYGYNKGYIEAILDKPPAGIDPQETVLECNSFLDCTWSEVHLNVLDRFDFALAKLESKPDKRWREMARKVDSSEKSSIAMGKKVWDQILGENSIKASEYDMLVELSLGYLLAGKAAVLGVMSGYAEQDVQAGRCGLNLDAGLYLWSNAYFMGLKDITGPGDRRAVLTCMKL